jgi:hypothetical protein
MGTTLAEVMLTLEKRKHSKTAEVSFHDRQKSLLEA